MGRKDSRSRAFAAHIEQLETRQVMSADPLGGIGNYGIDEQNGQTSAISSQQPLGDPDFSISTQDQLLQEEYLRGIEQALAEAHNQTGWNAVQSQYGFTGRGQTVVVIDSGIAYDHFALGGGLGANYRVVGGWDFAENDANPYDDGASGGHGTHVAGIVGNSSGAHSGVAPGVDLVSLRVFNDAGNGYFSWVESSLKWVLNNLNNFENPITTINLSLGVSTWNADTVPEWTKLEDEFAQLEAKGIFIAVAAGNSYANFNSPGLSYPAASQYVVPVMSTDDGGSLSYFSQRLGRAIAAPGRSIVSTVPDYKGNKNGVADDFATLSGTSMAAPYVAGASVIIREAMQFVGMTNITQDTIYDHMMATADVFYDAVSKLSYKRLDLQAAIDALMPSDDYGSTRDTAHNLGTISSSASINGVIGTAQDQDYFTFTAASSGSVSFAITSTSGGMAPSWEVFGPNGQSLSAVNGAGVSFDVVAGQSYTVRLSSTGGTGSYSFDVTAASSFAFEDWGTVAYGMIDDVAVTGEAWYRVQASQAGFLTVQGAYNSVAGNVNVELYDANMQLVATGTAADGVVRVDAQATAGKAFYVRVTGASDDVDFKLVNLVNQTGSVVTASGTAGDDAISFTSGAISTLSINGVAYNFAAGSVSQINVDAGAGNDSIVITGSTDAETATLRYGSASLASESLTFNATGVENVTVGGDAADEAILYDSAGDDKYYTFANRATMSSDLGSLTAAGFGKTTGIASTGYDFVRNYDSAGDDVYRTYVDRTVMEGAGFANEARGFDKTFGYSSQGIDRAYSYDSAGNDKYSTWSTATTMTGDGFYNRTEGFELTYGYASGGFDTVNSYDSAGDDQYSAWSDRVVMSGAGFYNYAGGFDQTRGSSTAGNDVSYSYGSDGNDALRAWSWRTSLSGVGFNNYTENFTKSYAYAGAGVDRAYLYDSAGDDLYRAWANRAAMSGVGYYNVVQDFDNISAYGSTGDDVAHLYDSAGDDVYRAWSRQAVMSGQGYYNSVQQFATIHGYSTTGDDAAHLYDSAGDDAYQAWSDRVAMSGAGFSNTAQGFDRATAYGSTGQDRAVMYDSPFDDLFTIRSWGARLAGSTFANEVRGFDEVEARSENGGTNSTDLQSVDFAFSLIGAWVEPGTLSRKR